MSINWSELDKQANSSEKQYLDYAKNGEHKVKLASVEIKDKDTWKSPAATFIWADGEYKYPRSVSHWLSMGNPAWRQRHNRDILVAFGFPKEKANQLIDAAEKSQERKDLVANYQKLYNQVASRAPEVEIVIQGQYRDGKPVCSSSGTQYSESDFKSRSIRMMAEPPTTLEENLLSDAEEINLDEMPF